MAHSESAWRAEVRSNMPQTRDFAQLAAEMPDLSSWRVLIANEPALRECLENWESYVQLYQLAVVIEQASEDGLLLEAEEIASRLEGCPVEWKIPFDALLQKAPEPIRDYLFFAYHCLVRIVRERRTGKAVWTVEAPSGSPEVLHELMFKWGPRFQRHRWTC